MVAITSTCPRCLRSSHNSNDAVNRYCSACKLFHGEPAALAGEDGASEFDCVGCDTHVVVFMLPDTAPICLTCRFLQEQVQEATVSREGALAMREHLRKLTEAT